MFSTEGVFDTSMLEANSENHMNQNGCHVGGGIKQEFPNENLVLYYGGPFISSLDGWTQSLNCSTHDRWTAKK